MLQSIRLHVSPHAEDFKLCKDDEETKLAQ